MEEGAVTNGVRGGVIRCHKCVLRGVVGSVRCSRLVVWPRTMGLWKIWKQKFMKIINERRALHHTERIWSTSKQWATEQKLWQLDVNAPRCEDDRFALKKAAAGNGVNHSSQRMCNVRKHPILTYLAHQPMKHQSVENKPISVINARRRVERSQWRSQLLKELKSNHILTVHYYLVI